MELKHTKIIFNDDFSYRIITNEVLGERSCGFIHINKPIQLYCDSDEWVTLFRENILEKVMGFERLNLSDNEAISVIYLKHDEEYFERQIQRVIKDVIFDKIEKINKIKKSMESFLVDYQER